MAEMLVGILVDSLEELNRMITSNYHENREICLRRLEVLAEQAMTCDGVSLDIVDLLNQAKNILRRDVETNKEYVSYEAPQEITGRRGRPRFCISEEQVQFFQGGG
jgi:hypothetical protein